ncbi:hypothetical protein [Clostridium sp.]|uniref:hypothetical protein n=1 Tax=Clostridium sp. TaxID=1506 RepID=UPI003F3930D9
MSNSVIVMKHLGGIKDKGKLEAHAKYVGFRSRDKQEEKGFFGRDEDHADYKDFLKRIDENKSLRHHAAIKGHKMVFSLRQVDYDAYKRSGKDYKDLLRETLKKYEQSRGIKLDWIASIHESDGHPHVHVIIKGVSDIKGERGYKRIYFKFPQDINDMKEIARKEFEKDVKYHIHEKVEVREAVKDTSRAIANFISRLEKEGGKEKIKHKKGNRFSSPKGERKGHEEKTSENYRGVER